MNLPEKKHPGYRPLEIGEKIEPGDWYDGARGFVSVSGAAMSYHASKYKTVIRFYENCFWRHVLTEDRNLGCDHQQTPDDHLPGPWLKDMPCPYPQCPAGQTGGIWNVRIPPPKLPLSMMHLAELPMFSEHRIITYESTRTSSMWGRGPIRKHYFWKLCKPPESSAEKIARLELENWQLRNRR